MLLALALNVFLGHRLPIVHPADLGERIDEEARPVQLHRVLRRSVVLNERSLS